MKEFYEIKDKIEHTDLVVYLNECATYLVLLYSPN